LQSKDLKLSGIFVCPHCQRELKVSRFYSTFFGLLALALSYTILFEFGLRDFGLVAGGLVGWFPIAIVQSLTLIRLFPPEPIAVDENIVQ
jgi:hypothetical protein